MLPESAHISVIGETLQFWHMRIKYINKLSISDVTWIEETRLLNRSQPK